MIDQERIAIEIFNKYGLDFKTATRAGGWTNAVWINGELVLRLSLKKDSDRIRREVRLAGYLPNEVGYPVNIAVGVMDGYEWSLSKRIHGNNLSDIWRNLSWKERTEVIRQIFYIMKSFQKVNICEVEMLSSKKAWYSTFNPHEAYSRLDRYKQQGIFSIEQVNVLRENLERFWEKHISGRLVLNHGDITMDNLLWFNGRIVSLLDFEHSLIAPLQFDLHSLINLAFISNEDDFRIDCNSQEYQQYKNDVTELLKPMLRNSDNADLILGYAILFRQQFLEFWLESPKGKIENVGAYKRLISLANGEGGYLSDMLYT